MSKIIWDKAGEHFYETGVDHGVLYPTINGEYSTGVAWNGLTGVTESPSGAESNAQYADNIKYLNLISAEEFGATVEAFTYPDEFAVCDGSAEPVPGVMIGQQTRRPFGLSYRTLMGNDLMGTEYGYKLHLIYNATASPSERAYSTVNDSPEALTFSWEVTTTPVEVPGYKPTASLTIDSTKVSATNMARLEAVLYGSADAEPRLPMPEEVFSLIGSSNAITLTVTGATASDLFGMAGSDLTINFSITDDVISGKLPYVENYTDFSTNMSEQEGNYLAINVVADPDDATVSVELMGGTSPVTKSDGKGNYVMRITNADSQTVRVTATKGKDNVVKSYKLTGLEIVSAAEVG